METQSRELGAAWVLAWGRASAETITRHRTELGELDRAIGDGDHGENLDRGYTAVAARLADVPSDASASDVLRLIATTLISSVGGAAGPLFGTAYLRAAEFAVGHPAFDGPGIAGVLAAARDGIVERGKAQPGDKTMIDAWSAAVDAAAESAQGGADAAAVLAAAADAAEAGAAATEPLVAHKGRASYLGERAIGHRDPGAESSALILRAAERAAAGAEA